VSPSPAVADPAPWLQSVRRSHDRLADLVRELDPSELSRRSYCVDWSVAQVLSHLGSQAEIFALFLEAGLAHGPAPAQTVFEPIWDAWNSRTPEDQAADSVAANEQLVGRLETLDEEELGSFRLDLFGMDLDAAGLLRMRLSEHAVHSWDVAVAFDATAQLAPDAVDLLIDGLPELVARAGRPAPEPGTYTTRTTNPGRDFLLQLDGVQLDPRSHLRGPASIELSAEGLLRLVYGRLDGSHLPDDLELTDVTLEDLRAVFPGF
jgi:uncharacterized protein (TIGR03083 family)